MANSDFVTSIKNKIRQGITGNNRPVSEALNNQMAGNINGLIESDYIPVRFEFNGYIGTDANLFEGSGYRLLADYDIIRYELSIVDTGSSGANGINVEITDTTGASVGDLFGTGANRVSISGNNLSNVSVERDVENATTTGHNTTGATVQFGNPTTTSLSDGYFLKPYVEQSTDGARSISLTLYLREV